MHYILNGHHESVADKIVFAVVIIFLLLLISKFIVHQSSSNDRSRRIKTWNYQKNEYSVIHVTHWLLMCV